MPRVLQVQSRICVGGPARFTLPLCEALSKARRGSWDTLLVGGKLEPGEVSVVPEAVRRGIKVQVVASMRRRVDPLWDARAVWDVGSIIRRQRPKVVHTHTAKAGAVGRSAAWLAQVPAIVHTFHGHVFDGYFDAGTVDRYVRIEQTLARASDAILVLSESQRSDIVDRYRIAPPEKVRVVPLGLRLEHFRALRSEPPNYRPLRRELGIAGDAPLLVAVGRLAPIKRFDRLIRAFLQALPSAPGSHALLVGDGEAEEKARLQALGRHPNIHFAGYRTDVAEILNEADVLALSSDNEGTPVAVIEALAAGTPVVATAVGGVAEIVPEGCGTVVPREDEAGLSRALAAALRGGFRVPDEARDEVVNRFSEARTADAVRALYDEILSRKGHVRRVR